MLFRGVSKFAVQEEAGWTGLVSQAGFQLPWVAEDNLGLCACKPNTLVTEL